MSENRSSLRIEYCGEEYTVAPETTFTIGRDADLSVDTDNPYLHRCLVELSFRDGFWWVANVGSRVAVTVSGEAGSLHSVIGPGSRLPVVIADAALLFTAGDTTYEVNVCCEMPPFEVSFQPGLGSDGSVTIGAVSLTSSQLLLLLALAEPRLRRLGSGPTDLPTNAAAAARLGWPITTFNRKLDNVCDKFDRAGVKGMHGGPGQHATQRRARLVEYAVAAKIVDRGLLELLDDPTTGDRSPSRNS